MSRRADRGVGLTAETCERAVTSVAQISDISPNVADAARLRTSAVISAYIRVSARTTSPSTSIRRWHLPGRRVSRAFGRRQPDLPDVERIEVLKGSAGHPVGRNTIGGAISIVARAGQGVRSGDVTGVFR
jgi:outer membrane receptor protein involved in Fe transport